MTINQGASLAWSCAILGPGIVAASLCACACDGRIGDFIPASSISRNGLATDAGRAGQDIAVWGFVDAQNLYGDASARAILGDWWSGDGPTPTTWRFNLKARAGDAPGRSFAVHVPNDPGRDALLRAFVANARAQRPTRVFVKGRLSVFAAPANVTRRSGLTLRTRASDDVSLTPQ